MEEARENKVIGEKLRGGYLGAQETFRKLQSAAG
jgi:hypothetical protein